MTVPQLFHRIGRHARTGDFTRLSMSERSDIFQSANSALAKLYNAAPSYFKELTEGFHLPAPISLTLTVVQFSNQLSSSVFTDDQIGRSVVLAGDPAWNQVIGNSTLLNPYMGSSGVVGATLYGDAVYSTRYPFDRIIGNPEFANCSQAPFFRRQLSKQERPGFPFQQTVGEPRVWWTQTLGNSQGNEPLLVLRFAPAPSIDYSINVRMAYWAKRLLLADYDSASTLPVPDQFLESALIPIAVRELMSTPAWKSFSDKDDERVDKAGEEGLLFVKNQPGQPAAPNNRVYTPIGF